MTPLATARADDVAAVFARRLTAAQGLAQPGPLPWLPAVPAALAGHPSWGRYLAARAGMIEHYSAVVADQAALIASISAPASDGKYRWRRGTLYSEFTRVSATRW